MKQRRPIGFILVLGTVLIASVLGLVRQRNETTALRRELEAARTQAGELAQLQAENQRLREKQISPAELEVLRADHAALPRLRSELEALKKSAPVASP